MKTKTLILMAVAVVCGLAASYLTSRMLAQQGAPEEEKVKILVAKAKIPMGTKLVDPEKFFVEKEFTKGQEPKKALTTFEQLKDRRLNKTIGAEVHVTPDDLQSKADEDLSDGLPPGYRAMTIRVGADTQVAGFVKPRSRVDIVSTTREGGLVTRTILQDMLVLAVDTADVRDPEKKSMPSSTVTLQVKPDEAEKLTMAGSLGELRLVLRPTDDHELVHTNGSKPPDLAKPVVGGGGGDEETASAGGTSLSPKIPGVPDAPVASQPVAKGEPEPEIQTHTMKIINGESITKAVFVLGDKEETTRIERNSLDPNADAPLPRRRDRDASADATPRSDKDQPDSKKDAQAPMPRGNGK